MNRIAAMATISALTIVVALLDFWHRPHIIASILFTFPIALCATQRSKVLLWSVAGAATLFSTSTWVTGLTRGEFRHPGIASLERGLLLASLLTLTTLIHLWINKTHKGVLDVATMEQQSDRLIAANQELEMLRTQGPDGIDILKDAEEKYRALLEAAPDAMVVVNPHGEIVLSNVHAEKQFGYPPDELIGQNVKKIIPKGFAERLIADDTRTAAEAEAQQIGTGLELTGMRKDGSEFPIEILLSLLASNEGVMVTAAVRDITDRKNTEDQLARMEDKYRGLLEAAPDAMVVVNSSGHVVLLNLQAERQFGYPPDELIGQSVKKIIPKGFAERLIADDTRSAVEALAQQMGTGLELTGLRKDGSNFPIEIMLSPLESSEGVLVTAAIRDITERKRVENALRENEERFRLIVSNVKDYANIMLDTDGLIVSWNQGAEKIKGYRADEIIGKHFSLFYTAEDIDNGLPKFELEQASTTGSFEGESWSVHKDGSCFFASVVLTALRDEGGPLRGYGQVTRDVTDRKESEEHLQKTMAELKRSNDELEQFAYVASHDLQEPLRMVASYTQLLAKRYQGRLDSDADEFIAYAVDGCNRMQRLIKDLLSYSRSGANIGTLQPISGETALEEALANLQVTIEENGAVVTHDALPVILTDETQLVQLFQNLVGNAIKYRSAEIPHVNVSATRNGRKEWIFSVQDNGLGIEPRYFDKIFVLFQRLHGRDEFEGTGIGLAMCKKIVDRLGGRIWVDSEPGKGSTFSFALPAGGVQ
jgi:PAS domain S-box-containing protein